MWFPLIFVTLSLHNGHVRRKCVTTALCSLTAAKLHYFPAQWHWSHTETEVQYPATCSHTNTLALIHTRCHLDNWHMATGILQPHCQSVCLYVFVSMCGMQGSINSLSALSKAEYLISQTQGTIQLQHPLLRYTPLSLSHTDKTHMNTHSRKSGCWETTGNHRGCLCALQWPGNYETCYYMHLGNNHFSPHPLLYLLI